MHIVRKVTAAPAAGDGLDFVISDSKRDRYDTVIEASGWSLANFQSNPIALFNHNSSFPIGRWENVRVEGGRLLGRLKLAKRGTSERIDELISLVEPGILRAVSVGFMPLERDGTTYKKQELLEASLVCVPGNAGAIQTARSIHISDETINLVFGKHAGMNETVARGTTAEHGAPPHLPRTTAVNVTIAQRISDAQTRLVALRDQLSTHLTDAGDEPDDAALAVRETLNAQIESAQRNHDSLVEAEKRMASTAVAVLPIEQEGGIVVRNTRPFGAPAKKDRPGEHFLRSLVGA